MPGKLSKHMQRRYMFSITMSVLPNSSWASSVRGKACLPTQVCGCSMLEREAMQQQLIMTEAKLATTTYDH